MPVTWKLQDAKARFSQLVNDAMSEGPQFVTKHGRDAVVVISTEHYRELLAERPTFVSYLLSAPKVEEFEIPPRRDTGRKIEL